MQKLQIFDLFTDALKEFEREDKILFSWQKNRLSLIHALAVRIGGKIDDPSLNVDIRTLTEEHHALLNPCIVVHNRQAETVNLAVMCKNGYLSENEQQALTALSLHCNLALAVSFFPRKPNILIYHAAGKNIEYLHFNRNTLTIQAIRKRSSGSSPAVEPEDNLL